MATLFTLFTMLTTMYSSQPTIHYDLKFAEPNTHLMIVEMTVQQINSTEISVAIPAWRPGRYSIQNYSRLIQEFSAVDGNGKPLPFKKMDKDTWKIETQNHNQIKVSYKFYAKILDAGSTYYDDTEIYFNGSNLFMYCVGMQNLPVTLKIHSPETWTIGTGLTATEKQSFSASNYHELIDSPTIISPTLKHEMVTVRNIPIHIWVQGETNANLKKLATDIEKIALAIFDDFGHIPFKDFHFLYHFIDSRMSHGVEHANSTSIVVGPMKSMPNPDNFSQILGVTAHELYHAWNVKKLIPKDLIPYDYTKEQYCDLFWFLEGFTSYYDNYYLLKTGLMKENDFLTEYASIYKNIESSPGAKVTSLMQASFDAWLSGYGSDGNPNIAVNFYRKGELIAFFLDLEIRKATNNKKQLSHVMKDLYDQFGVTDIGFTSADVLNSINKMSGKDFTQFYRDYIDGTKPLQINESLLANGFELVKIKADPMLTSATGIVSKKAADQWVISNLIPDSPAQKNLFFIDDIILAINSKSLANQTPDELINLFKTESSLNFTLVRKGNIKTITLSNLDFTNSNYTIIRSKGEVGNF